MARVKPQRLYSAQESREVDRCAIDTQGLPGIVLMERAATASLQALLEHWPDAARLQVLCGPGNNGGDGLLLAAMAHQRGIDVDALLIDGEPRSEDARLAAQRARAAGLSLPAFEPAALDSGALLVDAMLGTGISGAPRPRYAAAISALNALQRPVLALDLPSGVNSDTGAVAGEAVRAAVTISFITAKRGLYTSQGPDCAGLRLLDDLEVPEPAYAAAAGLPLLDLQGELSSLPPLPQAAHKGHFGRCLLIGGDHGMGGAIILAAEAALRSGVGLLRVATRAEHLSALLARRPEAMALAVRGRPELETELAWADALVVGPGLGQGPWGEQLLQAALHAGKPLLLDADALNLLARNPDWELPPNSVITPHPGEAARLLGQGTATLQGDRFAAAQSLAERSAAAVILKGNGSLVATGETLGLCAAGNPGMASGGMGDVLSGVGGAMLAQGLAPGPAARLACTLHAEAGDRAAARQGRRGLLASDLMAPLAELLA